MESCINSSSRLLNNYHETFVDVVKHSLLKNSISEMKQREEFEKSYEKFILRFKPPAYLSSQVEMMSNCMKTGANLIKNFNSYLKKGPNKLERFSLNKSNVYE
jgi:hypothetical protein